jgi:hypothetical protein
MGQKIGPTDLNLSSLVKKKAVIIDGLIQQSKVATA